MALKGLGKSCAVLGGSGVALLQEVEFVAEVLNLATRYVSPGDAPKVLYLGTATYDEDEPFHLQTTRFREKGAEVRRCDIANDPPPLLREVEAMFAQANVIVVSGGNTLYAMDRFKKLGIPQIIDKAVKRGVVLAGGSAGAIIWFDGGHSDSADPASFKAADRTKVDVLNWEYIRVSCLGLCK